MSNLSWMQQSQLVLFEQSLGQIGLEMMPIDEDESQLYYETIYKCRQLVNRCRPSMSLMLRVGAEVSYVDVWRMQIDESDEYLVRFWKSTGPNFDEAEFHLAREIAE